MTGQGPQGTGLARAEALLRIGRTESARELISHVLSAEPENVAALCLLARSYQVDGNFPAMRTAAGQAVAVAPQEYEAQVMLAFAHVELDDAESAAVSAREAVRIDPDDWRGHAALAMAWFNLGYRRRGFRAIRRAVELAPDVAGSHYIRALMFQTIGWTVGARRSYRRALALDPQHTAALTGLGRIAAGGNRFAAAGGHLSAALATAPTDHAARTELDRLVIGGLGGWTLMAVWTAGFLAMFAVLPKMWLLPLAVLALPVWWIRRTWRGLAPGVRAYAVHLIRNDIRARVRVAGLSLFVLTGAGVGLAAALQDPDRPPSAGMLIVLGAHVLALMVTGLAIGIADRLHLRLGVAGDPAGARQTDLLAERREASDAGRWMLRVTRAGTLLAVVPYGMGLEPAAPWPARAIVATVALAALVGYARWSRRRLFRRPGRPNAALGMLVAPLAVAALAQLVAIAATAVLPPAAMPLPSPIAVSAAAAITVGLLAWLVWLPYAAVRGLTRLVRERRTTVPDQAG